MQRATVSTDIDAEQARTVLAHRLQIDTSPLGRLLYRNFGSHIVTIETKSSLLFGAGSGCHMALGTFLFETKKAELLTSLISSTAITPRRTGRYVHK